MMKPKPAAARMTRGKILIVEDDPDTMKFVSTLLRASGYEVHQASYPLQAFFSVVRHPPDLILADIQMPVMNGLDMIRQLKAHGETQHIPVVVVTGSEAEDTRKAAFAAGCSGYITKPLDTRSFVPQVAKYL
jgi:CheY-like chemotaxis protein